MGGFGKRLIRRLASPAFLLFLVFFGLEVSIGAWYALHHHFLFEDAISRVVNSYLVLYSRDPHLAAIGLIWPPLPSLLVLPILLLKDRFPELAAFGFSGILVTAAFSAATVSAVYTEFRRRQASRFTGLLFAALLGLHPMVLLYGANGMSEMMFCWFLVWTVICLNRWAETQEASPLILAAFALALAFFVRYEAAVVAVAAAFAVAIRAAEQHRNGLLAFRRETAARDGGGDGPDGGRPNPASGQPNPEAARPDPGRTDRGRTDRGRPDRLWKRLEGTLIVALTPFAYSALAWILLNFMIMGDPLYFLRSTYSNASQTALAQDPSLAAGMDIPGLMELVWAKSLPFLPPVLFILALRLVSGRWKRTDTFGLLALVAAIPALQLLMLMTGSSFAWLRFFLYPLVIAAAWLPHEYGLYRSSRLKPVLLAGAAAAFLASAALTWNAMNNPDLAPDEYTALHFEGSAVHERTLSAIEVAEFLDRLIGGEPDALILTDSFSSYEILVKTRHPKRFVNSTDRDFASMLDASWEGVRYILVPNPQGQASLDAISAAFPGLYEEGYEWTRLVGQVRDRWKIYEVIGPPGGG